MQNKRFSPLQHIAITVYTLLYSSVSFLTLATFPLVHSDEAWLAGLSAEYIKQGTPLVTEPFFDLMPRTPHMMKSLFHYLQVICIKAFGYSIDSVRLLSLVFSIACLIAFYALILSMTSSKKVALFSSMALSLNPQFLYAGHFARQEILLLFILITVYSIYSKSSSGSSGLAKNSMGPVIAMGIVIGIAIALHPNAFIIAVMIGILLIRDWLSGKRPFGNLIVFALTLAGFGILHISVALYANPNFVGDWFAYGRTLSVDAAPASRFGNFIAFYLKLYDQISGTYYIPPMKWYYIGTAVLTVSAVAVSMATKGSEHLYRKRQIFDSALLLAGFNLAVFIIGRFNTTSITFSLLPAYVLLAISMHTFSLHMYKQTAKMGHGNPGTIKKRPDPWRFRSHHILFICHLKK